MRKKLSGIYCYENLVNGKRYIGQSQDLYKRHLGHEQFFRRAYSNGTGRENKPLWLAVQKYGRENFQYHILGYFPVSELDDWEIFYISLYKTHISDNGYNLKYGGNSSRGHKYSEDARRNMSKAHVGEKHTKEQNEKIGKSHVGMKYKTKKSSSKHLGIYQRSKTYGRSKVLHWVVDIREAGKRFTKHCKDEIDAIKEYNKIVIENNLERPLNEL